MGEQFWWFYDVIVIAVAALCIFITAKKGLLKEINNVDKASSMNGVIAVFITGKVGKSYEEATDDSARFGYVVCEGATTKDAMELCDKAISGIDFVLE